MILNSPTISYYIEGKSSFSCSFPTGKQLLLETSLTDFPCLQMKPVKQLKSFTYFTERKFLRGQNRAKFSDISFRYSTFLYTLRRSRNFTCQFLCSSNCKGLSQYQIFSDCDWVIECSYIVIATMTLQRITCKVMEDWNKSLLFGKIPAPKLHKNERNRTGAFFPCAPTWICQCITFDEWIAVEIVPSELPFNTVFYSWNIFWAKLMLHMQHAKVWKGWSYSRLVLHYGNQVRFRNALLKLFRNHDAYICKLH